MDKRKRTIIVLLIILILLGRTSYVKAKDNDGKILLNKNAERIDQRKAKVTLVVDANKFLKFKKANIILVLDNSGSMKKADITNVKNETNNLINKLLTANNNIKMGIVTYSNNVLDQCSSTSLSSDATELINLVNNIPSSGSGGTNIHAGLIKANELLANTPSDTQKTIIVLSDGEPTRFIGTNNNICGTGNSDNADNSDNCTINGNNQPSTVTTSYAEEIKNNGIGIYSIGFKIDANSVTEQFLKQISSNDKVYLTNDLEGLITHFDSILAENIETIALNSLVVDIIPESFVLISDSIQANNGQIQITSNPDKSTTLTWHIGNITSGITQTLSYIIEAQEDNYGNMYTNLKATLTANLVDGNPYYQDEEVSLDFPKPAILIPCITTNDDYTQDDKYFIKPEEILKIASPGILANDKLNNKNTAENAIITNKIVIVYDDEHPNTAGNLDNITIDAATGALNYSASQNNLENVTYKYYVETTMTLNDESSIVKSNTSTITLKIIDTTANVSLEEIENPPTGDFLPFFSIIIIYILLFFIIKKHNKIITLK